MVERPMQRGSLVRHPRQRGSGTLGGCNHPVRLHADFLVGGRQSRYVPVVVAVVDEKGGVSVALSRAQDVENRLTIGPVSGVEHPAVDIPGRAFPLGDDDLGRVLDEGRQTSEPRHFRARHAMQFKGNDVIAVSTRVHPSVTFRRPVVVAANLETDD